MRRTHVAFESCFLRVCVGIGCVCGGGGRVCVCVFAGLLCQLSHNPKTPQAACSPAYSYKSHQLGWRRYVAKALSLPPTL